MRRFSRAQRLRYGFDNIMARGPIALIGWLFLLSLIIILIVALVVQLAQIAPQQDSGERLGFAQLVWMGLMRTLDAGTMGGDSGSWPFLFAMLAVTIGGVFVVSSLIGILSAGIEEKFDDLRKGRSVVIERNHTVILGWSDLVLPILSELIVANGNQKRACIAILAEKDKVEMEDEIRSKVGPLGATHIVCRTGNPLEQSDLDIVNPQDARAIIVLSADQDDPDAHLIKVLLALTNNAGGRSEPYHIVAEIHNRKNLAVARLVGRDAVTLVESGDLIPRIMAQTCRQSGLSVVYTELLDFGGDEIYMTQEPGLVGKTFGEALFAYERCAVIGLLHGNGRAEVGPAMSTVIGAADSVIAIAQDDDQLLLSTTSDYGVQSGAIAQNARREPNTERTLVLGWNSGGSIVIGQLDSYVAPGSETLVVAREAEAESEVEQLGSRLRNMTCAFRLADTADRAVLDDLRVTSYDHVIVLSCSDTLGAQEADARTLMTLLHLRDIADKSGHPFSITSEMMDVRNRALAEVTRADDFVVGSKLVSLMLAQLAENKKLAPVFADLFDPEGVEIYLKSAQDYVVLGSPVGFYTVLESARRQGQVAIGYRLHGEANDAAKAYGVHVNPDKSKSVTFNLSDRIVVLSEE